MIHPILLCGGSGTRLWPLSRRSYPKQFTRLSGDHSLFQDAARRLSGPGFAAPVVVTGEDFRFTVTEQLAQVEQVASAVLIEPAPRNTAPAVLAAALWLARTDPEALMLVAPSDHLIADAEAFRAAIHAAAPAARDGQIVTFGITPTGPETAYGYLELPPGADAAASTPQPLTRFVEKPDAEAARTMVEAGSFLWNAGLFLASVATLRTAYAAHAPAMLDTVSAALDGATPDLGFTRMAPEPWDGAQDISIDYAIMEHSDNLVVMPFAGDWSDLGDWDAVWRSAAPDAQGNVAAGPTTTIDCTDTLLRSESDGVELVGLGLAGIVAVATDDAVLVADRTRAQDVRLAVADLKARNIPQATEQRRTHRPWGWYEVLVAGERFQVKRIRVHPGGTLSLQSHHHRAEHWVVVQGTARVTVGDDVQLVSENQSIYVPVGARHRLENPGKLPITLIEVQTGAYLGEDDIVRYEDIYARH